MPRSKSRRKKSATKLKKEKADISEHYFNLYIKMFDRKIKTGDFEDVSEIDSWINLKTEKYVKSNIKNKEAIEKAHNQAISYIGKILNDFGKKIKEDKESNG